MTTEEIYSTSFRINLAANGASVLDATSMARKVLFDLDSQISNAAPYQTLTVHYWAEPPLPEFTYQAVRYRKTPGTTINPNQMVPLWEKATYERSV